MFTVVAVTYGVAVGLIALAAAVLAVPQKVATIGALFLLVVSLLLAAGLFIKLLASVARTVHFF